MNAQNILLTHFSQRYPKLPDLGLVPMVDESARVLDQERRAPIAVAFDCASMRVGSMWKMEHYMDALAKTFPQEDETAPTEEDLAMEPASRPASPTKKAKRGKGKQKT